MKIKKWREKNKLTQAQAAKILGVSIRWISECESGRTKPSKTICNLIKMFNNKNVA